MGLMLYKVRYTVDEFKKEFNETKCEKTGKVYERYAVGNSCNEAIEQAGRFIPFHAYNIYAFTAGHGDGKLGLYDVQYIIYDIYHQALCEHKLVPGHCPEEAVKYAKAALPDAVIQKAENFSANPVEKIYGYNISLS